ncbi:3-methyl-2-oxobutanoate dehydrogenase subunit VorB [Marispirochaeta sp.]|jgi:2-oxoisovalerate ferredoxin oxidoreductase alpha subunit|uniref:3-methyl-2-oxobutanoate dehydrogenase subunit VorB n=1 Tax=Marispirochaeta sp. TaxID=2038653 RepID=UPI0029C60CA5|nr:3-methyl-2-oxobutanoate dehydrogenase subunit VorB [Marispirochaeta sp.]
MHKQLIKGNEAVIYGALLGGSTHFFGYPITPASEIAHAAAAYFRAAGRTFLQGESEVSVINMIYGAASAGARVMSASSGPGIALMAEGISYIAGAELPAVLVDVQRAGPGLGNIWPEQSDYNMVVKGGGHGNYRNIVLAPNSAQEMCDFTYRAFELADKYRMLVFILTDAYIGQMMEPVSFPEKVLHGERHTWAVYGDKESRKNLVTSILMNRELLSQHNLHLQEKYRRLEKEITDYQEVQTGDAELVFVAYGISSRLCYSAVSQLRKKGIKAGLLRPKTLYPFPRQRLEELASSAELFISLELSNGQMADDVEIALMGRKPLLRYNWMGGVVPEVSEIVARTESDLEGVFA